MPGTGISIIRRAMEIRNKVLFALQKVRNGIVQHRKTWLPYIGILVCLGAIWTWWDEPSQGQEHMKRDAAQHEAGSHPVFSASDEAERETVKETSSMMSDRPCAISPYRICLPAVCRRRLLRLKRYRCPFRRLRLKKSRNNRKKRKKKGRCPSSVVPSMKEIFTWSF